MSDFDEACGQHVEEEAADKLIGWESNQPGFFWVGVIRAGR